MKRLVILMVLVMAMSCGSYPHRQYTRDYKGCHYYSKGRDVPDRHKEIPKAARKNKDKKIKCPKF